MKSSPTWSTLRQGDQPLGWLIRRQVETTNFAVLVTVAKLAGERWAEIAFKRKGTTIAPRFRIADQFSGVPQVRLLNILASW
jgi:hypothetical protein